MITAWLSTVSATRIAIILTLIGLIGGYLTARPDRIDVGLHPSWLEPAGDLDEHGDDPDHPHGGAA